MADTNTQALTPKAQFHQAFTAMESQFSLALPKHMPVERFMRVVLTAVNGNPDLLDADRASLFEAAMKAAQDGLLPDGREGALVIYNTKVSRPGDKDRWIKKVQWMPMVAGIMKKARNSGEIALITAGCVWGGDKFRYWIDDDGEHIFYEPGEKQDFNVFVAAFAMAKLKDGTIYALRVTPTDVEKMRSASKAKDGPAWKNWYDQMAQKGAIRRLAKRLPMSSDLDDLIRRDDELYDFSGNDPERVSFQPVKNPLQDTEPKAIEHDQQQEELNEADEQEGREAAMRSVNNAGTVIEADDRVSKHRGGKLEAPILDRRFNEGHQWFDTLTGWSAAADAGDLPDPKFPTAAGGAEAPDSDGGKSDAPAPADAKGAQAASAGPAKAGSGGKAAKAKPYTDGNSYMEWLKGELAGAKTKAAVTDMWGATRADRQELLTMEQTEDATEQKAAAIARFNKDK